MDGSGRIVGYAVCDLDDRTRSDWRLGEHHVWSVERGLYRARHMRLKTSNRRYARALRRLAPVP